MGGGGGPLMAEVIKSIFLFRVNSDDIFFQYIESAEIIDNTSRYGGVLFLHIMSNAFLSSDLQHYL